MEKIDTNPSETESQAIERLLESVERATEFYNNLKEFDGTDVVGAEARGYIEFQAAELTDVLKSIPAAVCIENGLPYHPTDEKYHVFTAPFPGEPDYPVSYEHQPPGPAYPERYPRADELMAA